jgi:hypothetical protein
VTSSSTSLLFPSQKLVQESKVHTIVLVWVDFLLIAIERSGHGRQPLLESREASYRTSWARQNLASWGRVQVARDHGDHFLRIAIVRDRVVAAEIRQVGAKM